MATERETINTSGDYGATETGIGTDVGAGGGDDVGSTGPVTGTTAPRRVLPSSGLAAAGP